MRHLPRQFPGGWVGGWGTSVSYAQVCVGGGGGGGHQRRLCPGVCVWVGGWGCTSVSVWGGGGGGGAPA